MSFTAALHTYFAVSSIDAVKVTGLEGVSYSDSLAGGAKATQEGPVVFDREVDRIYLGAPDAAMQVRGAGSAVRSWQRSTARRRVSLPHAPTPRTPRTHPPPRLQIHDAGSGRRVCVHKAAFPDAVVWNPWVGKSQAMADFGDEEYKVCCTCCCVMKRVVSRTQRSADVLRTRSRVCLQVMLCIEPAVAGSGSVELAAGASWSGSQTLVVEQD
jgi:glucose-6-phosphate 1-epimerase